MKISKYFIKIIRNNKLGFKISKFINWLKEIDSENHRSDQNKNVICFI